MTIKEFLSAGNYFGKKSLGQNFLIDSNIIHKICSFIPKDSNFLIEIGPGPGILTKKIRDMFPKAKIIVIEKDSRFIDELKKIPRVEVLNLDVLKVNWSNFLSCKSDFFESNDSIEDSFQKNTNFQESDNNFSLDKPVIIGNLPYNISVPILFLLIENKDLFKCFLLMFQKEVADRISSFSNIKNYGKLSVMVQSMCEIHKMMDIKPTVFWPQPKIMSTVLKFYPKFNLFEESEIQVYSELNKFVSLVFQQRRKMLGKILRDTIQNGIYTQDIFDDVFSKYNLCLRPENLSVQEFLEIAVKIYVHQQK